MFKIQILKNSIVKNEATFSIMEELNVWLDSHKSMKTFGADAYSYEQAIELQSAIPAVTEEQELLDEQGQSFAPAQFETVEISLEIPAVIGTETIEVPAEYEVVIQDISLQNNAELLRQQKIKNGKDARETCQIVLDLIAGYNLERELTLEQISQLQNMLSQPEAALRAGRPSLAKLLISTVVPDEDLVTTEMKSEALLLLTGY